MRLIIDTCTFLWMASQPENLPSAVRAMLADPDNTILLSVSSIWEMGIKRNQGRLDLTDDPKAYFAGAVIRYSLSVLPVTFDHALTAAGLPLHHRDPFDRMLIAQSMVEGVPIATPDGHFGKYPVQTVW